MCHWITSLRTPRTTTESSSARPRRCRRGAATPRPSSTRSPSATARGVGGVRTTRPGRSTTSPRTRCVAAAHAGPHGDAVLAGDPAGPRRTDACSDRAGQPAARDVQARRRPARRLGERAARDAVDRRRRLHAAAVRDPVGRLLPRLLRRRDLQRPRPRDGDQPGREPTTASPRSPTASSAEECCSTSPASTASTGSSPRTRSRTWTWRPAPTRRGWRSARATSC